MQPVDKHISQLLYEHDCVIIPDLGGFVANYQSAKIHPVQHTFAPPSKNISFNVNLNKNDGLLANHIVTNENTNYPEALKYINRFVDTTNSQLKKGIKVKIDEVGTLFFDIEHTIQFEPSATNFLLDSFGLNSFQSPAIQRGNVVKRIEKEFKDRAPIAQAKKKINVKRYVAVAIAAPLLFAILWIPLKTGLLKNINYSAINPFASKEIKMSEVKDNPKAKSIVPVIKKDTAVTENKSTEITSQPIVTPVKADSTAVAKKSDTNMDYKFHLVVGCFQIEDNAINFVATLQKQNLDASIIEKNNKGLFVVSCGNYPTNIEAASALGILRKQQPNAWLYRN